MSRFVREKVGDEDWIGCLEGDDDRLVAASESGPKAKSRAHGSDSGRGRQLRLIDTAVSGKEITAPPDGGVGSGRKNNTLAGLIS